MKSLVLLSPYRSGLTCNYVESVEALATTNETAHISPQLQHASPKQYYASRAHQREKLCVNRESSLAPTHLMALCLSQHQCLYHYCSTQKLLTHAELKLLSGREEDEEQKWKLQGSI